MDPCGIINMQWFRGGLVFKVHRLLYHSTRRFRVMTKTKKKKHAARKSTPSQNRQLIVSTSNSKQ